MPWDASFPPVATRAQPTRIAVPHAEIDLRTVVTIDFETYFDAHYTLKKLSTSEYIRDPRFKAHMMGIKIGRGKTRIIRGPGIAKALAAIDWSRRGLLCHNTAFDGFILSHHYGIKPAIYYDTLSMARGLHSNDIGAGLDEVARFYGVGNKLEDVLMQAKGQLKLSRELYAKMAAYCTVDVDLTIAIFEQMLADRYPADEIELIHQVLRMFNDPVLRVDLPRVAAEHAREVAHKKQLLLSVLTVEDRLVGTEDEQLALAKKKIGGRDSFVALLAEAGVEPPTKLNKNNETAYAFAKTDLEFTALLEHPDERVRELVEARLGVKSSLTETRAVRFLEAGKNGWRLPVGYGYYRAHTGRLGASNKMNLQNLTRGGELRRSILAPKGHVLPVCDSGQIEARMAAWIAGQIDLLDEFREYDAGRDRDPYCKFGDVIYEREITKDDKLERFVSKVGVLALGFQMGGPRLQTTLALGTMGPPVYFELDQCRRVVTAYRVKNRKIVEFWSYCLKTIIPQMASGTPGSWKCLSWGKETIYLPNGMRLKYPQLRCDASGEYPEWTYERKGVRTKIYGGLLTENIVQALARIIVTGQLLEIAKRHRVVMMTHDEVVAMVRAASGKKALAAMIKIMSTSPAWCPDLPLTAEGDVEIFYSK